MVFLLLERSSSKLSLLPPVLAQKYPGRFSFPITFFSSFGLLFLCIPPNTNTVKKKKAVLFTISSTADFLACHKVLDKYLKAQITDFTVKWSEYLKATGCCCFSRLPQDILVPASVSHFNSLIEPSSKFPFHGF